MFWNLAAGALAILLMAGESTPLALAPPLTASERQKIDRGDTVVRTLDGPSGTIGVIAVNRTTVSGSALIDNVRSIEELKRSRFVTAIHRFSDPPRIGDLDQLTLSAREIAAIAACRVGSCSFKLTASEIDALAAAAADRGAARDAALQQAFRRLVLARVESYRAGGLNTLPPLMDRAAPLHLGRLFDALVNATPQLPGGPAAAAWLHDGGIHGQLESFLYWSQENYGAGKPVVSVTHVAIVPPAEPDAPAMVFGKQIFASHYMIGEFALMAVTRDDAGGGNYLIYMNRTAVDLFGGLLGPIKRAMLESRLRSQVPEVIGKLRLRLERGASPALR